MGWTAPRKRSCPHLIRHGSAVPPSPRRGRLLYEKGSPLGSLLINLSFFRQDAAQVVDGVAGAFDGALAAGEAEGLVDVREVVLHGDGPGGAELLTDAAADAADLAHLSCILAGIPVRAFDDDGVGAFVDADELARAFTHAFAAGDALDRKSTRLNSSH